MGKETKVAQQLSILTFEELYQAARSAFQFAALDMHEYDDAKVDAKHIDTIDDDNEWKRVVSKAQGKTVFVRVFERVDEESKDMN